MEKKYADKLKVGDKVTIKSNPVYKQKKGVITEIRDESYQVDDSFFWNRKMLQKQKQPKAYTHNFDVRIPAKEQLGRITDSEKIFFGNDVSFPTIMGSVGDPLDNILKDVKESGKHFDDLTEIDCKLEELDKDTRDRLKDAQKQDGYNIQRARDKNDSFDNKFFVDFDDLTDFGMKFIYRLKSKENKIPQKIICSTPYISKISVATKINEIIDYLGVK